MEFQKEKGRPAPVGSEPLPLPGQVGAVVSAALGPRSHVPRKEAYFDELPEKGRFGVGGPQGKLRHLCEDKTCFPGSSPFPPDFSGSSGISSVSFPFVLC